MMDMFICFHKGRRRGIGLLAGRKQVDVHDLDNDRNQGAPCVKIDFNVLHCMAKIF
jgi:hypothetical protein